MLTKNVDTYEKLHYHVTMQSIEPQLTKIGLKNKEIAIYLALLSFGKATVSDLARKININRTTIYSPLSVLIKKGFVYKILSKKTIYYSPENPTKIISILEAEKRKISSQQKNIEKIIPELKNIYKSSFKKPQISTYEGKNGILEAYKKMTDSWQDIYSIFSPRSFFNLFTPEQNNELLMKLKERNIKLYNLTKRSSKTEEILKIKKYNSFVKRKILPNNLKFSTDLLVTKDKLALISFNSLIAVIIEDKAIADMQNKFLKFIWKKI